MKSLNAFFADIKSSFYNPAFYSGIPTKNTGNAVVFLLGVSALSAFALVIYISILGITAFSSFSVDDVIAKNYPENLVVTVKDGKASVNQPEPFIIPLEEDMKDTENPYENFLVIDTRPEATVEELNSYNAFAVLTKERVFLASDEKDGRVIPLTSVKDLTVDKTAVSGWAESLLNLLWVIAIPLVLLAIVLITVFSLVFHLVASLIGAVLVIAVGMIRKTKLEYQDAYKIALFASAPVIIMQTIAMFFSIPNLPMFLDTLLFVVIVFANLGPKKDTLA
jgi:hypothetical protein